MISALVWCSATQAVVSSVMLAISAFGGPDDKASIPCAGYLEGSRDIISFWNDGGSTRTPNVSMLGKEC